MEMASEEASGRGLTKIGTEHFLLALLREEDAAAVRVLWRFGINPTRVRQRLLDRMKRGSSYRATEMQLTPNAKQVLDFAVEESKEMQSQAIGTEHLLLGLLHLPESLGGQVLVELGASLESARREAMSIDNGVPGQPRIPAEPSEGEEASSGPAVSSTPPPADVVEAMRHAAQVALSEDLTPNDLTTELTVPASARSVAVAVAKAEGVIAGLEAARQAFLLVDPNVRFTPLVEEGGRVAGGEEVFRAEGPSRSLLTAERTVLNLLQHLSGVATETARYVKVVEGTRARIIDTRKTTPGLRRLEKYAVRVGGGKNHRYNLSDGILIKDNHIVAAGGITAAVRRVQADAPHTLRIEVEVTNDAEIEEALNAGADALLLDNMTPEQLKAAVQRIGERALTEASGGITRETVRAIAESGVNYISVGALTHSVKALDISLQFRPLSDSK
jgi:nicotinate-nucleotide pyrophosphorylase (carboxylating)